ncbi:hypothetical protein OH492_19900 [Vibrio chagasii]|nr:hypothetical protein [Vibrio chagasii]
METLGLAMMLLLLIAYPCTIFSFNLQRCFWLAAAAANAYALIKGGAALEQLGESNHCFR